MVLWTAVASVAADIPPLILEHLTTSEGLPQGTVMTTLQDSQGFVWLGTEDGLVRYDGHELYRYSYSRNNAAGLPGNFINQLAEDAHHDLWIAIKDAGLARWNRAADTFTVYRHAGGAAGTLSSDGVRALLINRSGAVWVGMSDAGIDVLDPVSGHIDSLRHDPDNPDSLIDDGVFTLTLDRSDRVWVGTAQGLDRWDPAHRRFVHLLAGEQVSRIYEDDSGLLWVGTFDHGLHVLDQDGHLIRSFQHDAQQPGSLVSDDVRAILKDQAGHLWIGTADGLDLLDRSSAHFDHYRQDASDTESLRDSFIMSLYQDDAGLVWIGTRSGGVSRWNPHSWELGSHRPEWLGGKPVTAFADAPNDRVWIASLGGGLYQFDGSTGQAQSIDRLLTHHDALADQRVMSLREDRRGALWIGTMASGLQKFSNGRLESIPVKAGDPHATSAAGIMTIYESRDGRIWIGTHGGGANILDPVTGLVRQLPFAAAQSNVDGALSGANVSAIVEDTHGNFWIGTDGGGLDLARPDGRIVRAFHHDPADLATLPANTVYALAVDQKGRVWVATDGGGLAEVIGNASTPEDIHFRIVTREEGLSSDTIYGIVVDSADRLWISGNSGLMRFDPDTGSVKTYHRQHGLQGEEFDFGAFHRLRDGRVCFGGPGGFNIFDPSHISENRRPPRLALVQVTVMGVPLSGGTPSWLLNRVPLNYRANILSLDFGALDFTSPKRNRIAYRMAGLTDSWIDLGNQHRITLTNLDAGDHVLEVLAANADSVWSETPLRLTIHRDPAPWRSPWAYTAYLLAALALIAYRVRLQRLKFRRIAREQQRLETEVALRTRELRESNQALEEAVQAKGRFMDRMSHELRTPMNGVLGMTELLVRTTLSGTQARLTQTIRSSAQVLLQIVNDLLDLSKINAGKVALEELSLDLVRILEECAALFAGATADKGVELIVCPPPKEAATLLGDPLRLRQIVMNLIGNAVKFTAQGEIVVRADLEYIDAAHATLRLSVADSGIGMDALTISKIFNPFMQADESTTRRFGGTGLGLAICRELTQLMGGTITVESQPQVGSTFQVSLPLKLGAEPTRRQRLPLPRRRAHIVSRRRALAEALQRYVAALGLEPLAAEVNSAGEALEVDDIVIVDGSVAQEFLGPAAAAFQGATFASQTPTLIIVASEIEVAERSFGAIPCPYGVLLRPVNRDALYEALSTASGAAPAPADALSGSNVLDTTLEGHVLLVEDEPVNAAVAQGYLATLGCTCVWVDNGTEAVSRYASERFDLVLMDLSMPQLDGFATTRMIRQQQGDGRVVPIVALTAHGSSGYRETCLQAGMDDILSKPCALEECANVLARWIGSPRRALEPRLALPDEPSAQGTTDHASANDVGWAIIDGAAVTRLRSLRSGGQSDLYERLIELFESGSARALVELRNAIERGRFEEAAAVCHRFASSAANVGALGFASHVRELERLCKAADAGHSLGLFLRLRAVHPQLLDNLHGLRLKASA